MTNLLVVTAVAAERDAICDRIPSGAATVLVGGIGPAACAAATSAALAAASYDAASYDVVLSAGIAGGFCAPVGAVAIASSVVFADLGAETADGFIPLPNAVNRLDVAPWLSAELARRTGAITGTVVTVATVTGTAATADALRARHPDVVAEAMEGFGVATAAVVHGAAFGEVRAISNAVGPRDRASWRVPEALDALGEAFATLTAQPLAGKVEP